MSSKTIPSQMTTSTVDSVPELAVLPVHHELKLLYLLSTLTALLTGIASAAGILFPDDIYPTAELQEAFIPTDVVNLLIGLPILFGSMWAVGRGMLIGLLFWPGALFFGLYNYLVYLLGMPFNAMYPLYLAIVALSLYTTIGLVAIIDGEAVKERLAGRVRERLSGGVLLGLGLLIMLRAVAVMVGDISSQTEMARSELALLATDSIVSVAWIIDGVLLWRRQPLGYVGGVGLLFQTSMLFVGLILFLLLRPFLTTTPFDLAEILVVFAMGFICFIPFALFLRGVVKS